MGTTASAIFTGASAYSKDFQNVVSRAVAIASLPINLLNSDKTNLTSQSDQLKTLDGKFAALQRALDGITGALDGSTFQATVSAQSVISAVTSPGAIEGNYSIQVTDAGEYAYSLGTSAWVAAAGAPHTYELWVGTDHYQFTPLDNSAASVVSALNAQFSDKVRATLVNVGPADNPDYRISLQAVKLGNKTLDLKDGGVSLETEKTQGRQAQYIVNNSGKTVTSDSRTVGIATGLTVNLLASSDKAVNITLTRSTSALTDALTAFTAAYNDAVDAVDGQRGQNAGALQGNSLVGSLAQALGAIATYTAPGGSISGLRALGLDLGMDGKLTFNSFALVAADMANSSGVTAFFGSPSGSGFLKLASDTLKGLEDPVAGLIKTSRADLQQQIKDLTDTIAGKQAQVDQLQQDLLDRMASADALIASMEQQYGYLSSMFSAMQTQEEAYK